MESHDSARAGDAVLASNTRGQFMNSAQPYKASMVAALLVASDCAAQGRPGPLAEQASSVVTTSPLAGLPKQPPDCHKCGPAPSYPSWSCPDGVHSGGRGPCIQMADGRCGWLHAVCPAEEGPECTPSECGTPPSVERWLCPDGKSVGQIGPCVREKNGGCGWAYQPCTGARAVAPKPTPPPVPPRPPPFDEEAVPKDHPCLRLDRKEVMSWPVHDLCDPIGHYPPILFGLPDGTSIYAPNAKECFRGSRKKPCYKKCLPGTALIATPTGPRRVDSLQVGSIVWSLDASGLRVAVPLQRVGSVDVGNDHQLIRIVLADGRMVQASWGHPTSDGAVFGRLAIGASLDGSQIEDVSTVHLSGERTFDILPASNTGFYWADGVMVGSSLKDQ